MSKDKKKQYLRIKEAAQYLKVTPQTLRNWDKVGKLIPARNPVNNYREYLSSNLDKLKVSNSDQQRVFILGSGFSSQLTNNIFPTSQQLLQNLVTECNHLRTYLYNENFESSIQSVLSRFELDETITEQDKTQIRNCVSQNLQRQLPLSCLYEDNRLPDAKNLVSNIFKPGDTVISLNWDILLEHLICINTNLHHEDPVPAFNYGSLSPMFAGTFSSPETNNGQTITILKPHGSFNFVDNDHETWPLLNTVHDGFTDSTWANEEGIDLFQGFQDVSIGFDIRQETIPPVILPSFVRNIPNSTFAAIWRETFKALKQSSEIIIIGYSFPQEDDLMRYALYHGLWREQSDVQSQGFDRGRIIRVLGTQDSINQWTNNALIPNANDFNISSYTSEEPGSFHDAYDRLIEDLNHD